MPLIPAKPKSLAMNGNHLSDGALTAEPQSKAGQESTRANLAVGSISSIHGMHGDSLPRCHQPQ